MSSLDMSSPSRTKDRLAMSSSAPLSARADVAKYKALRALGTSTDLRGKTGAAVKARTTGAPLENKRALAPAAVDTPDGRAVARSMHTPTPSSKLPQSTLSKRVSKLGLSSFSDSGASSSIKPPVEAPLTAVRSRKIALAPSTPSANTKEVAPPVTAIRVRKPALPRPASVVGANGYSAAQAISAAAPAKKHVRTASVQAAASSVKMERTGGRPVAGPRTSVASGEVSPRRPLPSVTSALTAAPARRSTRPAKTSTDSLGSSSTTRTPIKAKPPSTTLPSRQSLSYASPPRYDFLKQDPNHSTPQRPPKTSTQPYEDLKARWRRNNEEHGSPGMLLSDSPIAAKLSGDVVSLDEMDDREVEMEMLRRELEALRGEVENMDLEKGQLVLETARLGEQIKRGEAAGWKAIVEMAEMALEEEEADARRIDASYQWLVTLDEVAARLTT